MYTQEEIQQIWDLTSGKTAFTNEHIDKLKKEFADKKIPKYLFPFIPFYALNPDLYRKICNDEKVKKYSHYGFFPETIDTVYGNKMPPEITFDGRNRGLIAIISSEDRKIVIKPAQTPNSREEAIARIADEEGVGPKQYPTLDGFLTEQFIEGVSFAKINPNDLSCKNLYIYGRRLGEILKKLHFREIFYNDNLPLDDYGHSHLIIPESSPAVLIDYGSSLLLDRHPEYSDEELYNYGRTISGIPRFQLDTILLNTPHEEHVKTVSKIFRPVLKSVTKEQIIERDLDFVNAGLFFAYARFNKSIKEPFISGFKETYS